MKQVLDLHIHSRYSRACSPQLTLENLDRSCRRKGVDIIATGDFTFPQWFSALESELVETFSGSGLYRLAKAGDDKIKFILGTEVSLVYKDGDRARRIHLVVHAPSLQAVAELNKALDKKYNIRSDGRPILGISAPEFVRLALSINPAFLVYPAHIWTPWYAVFGSKSGFDSLEECFKGETENIYAIETGLSSDPAMNWRLSDLDSLTILSSSDAHSLANIGREANVMELSPQPSYEEIYNIIKKKKRFLPKDTETSGLLETLEFYPEEGMYHIDGHRSCGFSCLPVQSRRLKNLCPRCHKPLVIGVLNRVEELADRPEGFVPEKAVPFKKVVELDKIIAEAFDVKSRQSVRVQREYENLLCHFGSELHILLDQDLNGLAEVKVDSRIIEGLRRVREGSVEIRPGFDGQYGEVRIFSESNRPTKQLSWI